MMDGSDTSVALYEELRRRFFAGASDLGSISFLREGVIAWMAHGTTCPAPAEPAAGRDSGATAPVLSDEVHAGMVRVLANMALAGRREMTP
jgi:hypothetical protein